MNKLSREKQEAVIQCFVNGASVRATERIASVHRDTALRLMVRVGDGCQRFMAERFRGLNCRHLQLDEVWGFVGKKQRRLSVDDDQSTMGDFWTFIALDTDSRFIPTFRIGKRDAETTNAFVADLASRVTNRVLISSDAMPAYVDAIDRAFGTQVDYGTIVKSYEAEAIGPGRYSPPRVTSVSRTARLGNPDPTKLTTTYVERSNLLMRMSIRRLTRLTDAFSRKLENFKAAIALHLAWYNLVRIHKSLRTTPARAAGVSDCIWSIGDLINVAEGVMPMN